MQRSYTVAAGTMMGALLCAAFLGVSGLPGHSHGDPVAAGVGFGSAFALALATIWLRVARDGVLKRTAVVETVAFGLASLLLGIVLVPIWQGTRSAATLRVPDITELPNPHAGLYESTLPEEKQRLELRRDGTWTLSGGAARHEGIWDWHRRMVKLETRGDPMLRIVLRRRRGGTLSIQSPPELAGRLEFRRVP